MEIRSAVYDTISVTFKAEKSQLNDELEIGDLKNWDSLGHMALISKLEEKFNITFELDEVIEMENINDIIEILQERFQQV